LIRTLICLFILIMLIQQNLVRWVLVVPVAPSSDITWKQNHVMGLLQILFIVVSIHTDCVNSILSQSKVWPLARGFVMMIFLHRRWSRQFVNIYFFVFSYKATKDKEEINTVGNFLLTKLLGNANSMEITYIYKNKYYLSSTYIFICLLKITVLNFFILSFRWQL
jgi:hypothetical protein